MANALDVASGDSDSGVSSITDSVTVAAGKNRRLIVSVANNGSGGSAVAPSSVTYAGKDLTKTAERASALGQNHVSIWELIAPPVGTADLIVTSSGTFDFVDVGWVVLQGASQRPCKSSHLLGQTNDNTQNPTISITALQNGVWAISLAYPKDSPATGSITTATEYQGGYFPDMGYSGPHNAGSVSHQYHGAASTEDWVLAMILVEPATVIDIIGSGHIPVAR